MNSFINWVLFALLTLSGSLSYASDTWVGNFKLQVTRATSDACLTNGPDMYDLNAEDEILLGDWAYTQATVASLCVDVYVPGVTEFFRTDIPNYLSVVGVFVDGNGVSRNVVANYIRHEGNNAIFEIKLLNIALRYDESLSRKEIMTAIKLFGNPGLDEDYTAFSAVRLNHNF